MITDFNSVIKNVKIQHRWKLHPQPSSYRKVKKVCELFNFRNKTVLDCFCGTGTIPLTVSNYTRAIGSDIEDYSEILRISIPHNINSVEFHWNIDALKSVKSFDYCILFFDPPNPNQVIGGRLPSAYRDTKITGKELREYYLKHFNENNLIAKKDKTLKYVCNLIDYALNSDKTVIMNVFKPYFFIKNCYDVEQIYGSYYIIRR